MSRGFEPSGPGIQTRVNCITSAAGGLAGAANASSPAEMPFTASRRTSVHGPDFDRAARVWADPVTGSSPIGARGDRERLEEQVEFRPVMIQACPG